MELYKYDNWFLLADHQVVNAKLYPDRITFLKSLNKNLDILEIGVAAGDFSEEILNECIPEKLYLLDLFDKPDSAYKKTRRYYANDNLLFVKNRFKNYNNVYFIIGDSQTLLPTIEINFDFIYIDADHTYDFFINDLINSIKILKPNGIIGINDYTYTDESGNQYGIVEGVHRFLKANLDWEIIGFALHDKSYNDIYIRRKLNI